VAATFTSTNTNYTNATGNGSLVINKAPVTATAGSGTWTCDGASHSPSACVVTGTYKGDLTCTNSPASVGPNPGTYTITPVVSGTGLNNFAITSVDGSYTINYGICSAAVGPGGVILPPININGSSVYNRKGGSTIPVKFRVCDASGNPISNPAAVFGSGGGSMTLLGAVRGTVDTANEEGIREIPDVAFRWSGTQWIFNMATSNLPASATYTFQINLAYGNVQFIVGVK
jgi:hypothetical protein